MPAIYWKHDLIKERAMRTMQVEVFSIPKHLLAHVSEVCYVIIVDKGRAWAARRILNTPASDHGRVLVHCVHYSDEITGKQILLKALLQGE